MNQTVEGKTRTYTDSHLLIAVFNALGALATRLTGETLIVCVQVGDDSFLHLLPDPTKITWIKAAASPLGGPEAEEPPMRCLRHAWPGATP